uniref:CARD domain-containing protein n=1 Tax=Magallana gigas TaxID=29159 RepID=A0A8W8NPY6_MAGGI
MLCIETTDTASVMTEPPYDRHDSGYPDSLVALETHHTCIRKNYKKLKEEMEPNEILDYLVQYEILDTDENTHLLKECRARKCDIILRKLIKNPDPEKFIKMMKHIIADECCSFGHLLCSAACAMESSNDGLDSSNTRLHYNLKQHGKHREKLLTEIRKRINVLSSNSILDDFLQEDLISVDEHEEISRITNKDEAAKKILKYSEKNRPGSFSRKLLSILKFHELDDLAESLQQDVPAEGDTADNERPLTVEMVNGWMFLPTEASSSTVKSVELRITHVDGSESLRVYRALKQEIPESEDKIMQGIHSTIDRLSEGSITIWLRTESSDAKEKLRHFIESGDISTFLESLFKTKGVRKLLTKDKYKIQIEIKVKNATEGSKPTAFQPKKESDTRHKARLDRCESFLLEELEPGCLVRDTEMGHIFSSVKADIENRKTRTDKVKLLLEHLKKESEETIELVLDRLKEKNRYVYDKLFPNVEKFQDLDIEQIKSNILDNLPEILDVMSVAALQTPFVSAGIMSYEELDSLHMSSESVRTENLHFVRMVLHRGDEAVRIFLVALENSIGMDIKRLLNKMDTLQVSKDERRNAKIEYEAFNEENGLLFQGNFLLELMSEGKSENMNSECLYVREEEPQQHFEHPGLEQPGSQSEESTSSDSDSNGNMQRDVSSKESLIRELESDTSSILSKLTRKLGKVEYVVDIRCILSTRDVSKSARIERVKTKYPKKYGAIKDEVLKLNTVLNKLQSLSRIFKDKVGFITNWNYGDDDDDIGNDDDDDAGGGGDDDDGDGDDDDIEQQLIEDLSETLSLTETTRFGSQMSALVVKSTDEGHIFKDKVEFLTNWNDDDKDDDDDDDCGGDDGDSDNEPLLIEDCSETLSSPETTLRFQRQLSALVVKSTDEDSTMDSDEDVPEDLNVLGRKSSKYQSILVGKLHELETVQNVMNIFRVISEEEMQLMAVKNILNEEQYKRLEKYIIKLQVISNKIEEATGLAKVA